MANDFSVNSNTDILEFKRKFNLFVSNYDKGEFDGDFEITGDLTVDGDVEIKGELKGAETQIANAVSTYISAHPFAPEMLEGQDISPDDISATGKITGEEIVENMSGYSFTPHSGLAANGITLTYVGVVKNGNKVTFVIAGTFDSSVTDGSDNPYMGDFIIPSSVGSKLIPMLSPYLELKTIVLAKDVSHYTTRTASMFKSTNTTLGCQIFAIKNGTYDGTSEYAFRIETTFLLSENLISNE